MHERNGNSTRTASRMATSSIRDDRIFILTRVCAALVILILILAFLSLYIFPYDTAQLFAWTIQPPLTAMLMGAGYIAGAYFFARVLTEKRWHRVQAGFLPITAFTILMALATWLHWERFHQGTFLFFLWVSVYAMAPFLVPFLWWRNRVTDPGMPEAVDYVIPQRLRRGLQILMVVLIVSSLFFYLNPDWLIGLAPWTLTALTARVDIGWFVLGASAVFSVASDSRWSAARILIQSGLFGLVLMLVAFARAWSDFNFANPFTWLFIVAFLGVIIILATGYLRFDSLRQSP